MPSFSLFFALSATLGALSTQAAIIERVVCDTTVAGDIYGFSEHPLGGELLEQVDFEVYRGQVLH